jgi:glycosyltransferase involved in cell wall biosynthesis
MRICRIATIPFSLIHNLGGQLDAIVEAGHELDLVCSRGPGFEDLEQRSGVTVHAIEMPRMISPIADFVALVRLWSLYRRGNFDIVHSTTPKAGLLSALAGLLAGVPLRLHTFTGQPWATLSGPLRWLARMSDRLVIRLNTQCYADSPSQRDFLIAEGLCRADQVKVLGAGSIAGVDVTKIKQAARRYPAAETKAALSIPAHAAVIAFIGRVTRDKGIVELIKAFERVLRQYPDCHLVIVGPLEPERDALPADILKTIHDHPRIRLTGYQPAPEKYLAAADLLCLPSYREGFGNVVIEAAALRVPTVGTSIVGLEDSVVDGETGLLVPPKNEAALADALICLLSDAGKKEKMGRAAEIRTINLFSASRVNALVVQEYKTLFESKTGRR